MKKIENEFRFLDTPQFNYEYKNEVEILGRKLIHIGDGVFMFEEPIVSDAFSLDCFKEKLKDYKDIAFIRFSTDIHDNRNKWIIPFAVSTTHRRHFNETIESRVRKYMEGFHIPDFMKCIINNIVENYLHKDYAGHESEEIYYEEDDWFYRPPAPADDECTHLLDFEHNADDGRYVFVNGFVGRKILDGIYYFDDAVSLTDNESRMLSNSDRDRLCSKYLNPDDFKENIAFIGKELWWGGSLMSYEGSKIYYMAFGDSAIGVLYEFYKNLSGYEMRLMKKDAVPVKNEPVDIMAVWDELEKKEGGKRDVNINIPEGARELIDGMGFHNLDVRCKLLFQDIGERDNTNSDGFSRYDVAYILDEKLYLINYITYREKTEEYALNLRMIKELSVIYRARLFDYVEEDIVQVVIENENAEKVMLGEEDYRSYLKFVTKKSW